jgi:meso-butanediol dehydrogenase/(S,S)-butanediol dehydrogenase/diacetyl reductase
MTMARRLEGKVAVITGTGDGIARAAARIFAAEGAHIVGCDLDEAKSAETARIVTAEGGSMISVHPVDLSREADVERVMDTATEKYGGVDIVFHTAMTMRFGTTEQTTGEDLDYTLSKVVTMSFLVAKAAIPRMRARGGGSIVLTGSLSGQNFGAGFSGNTSNIIGYSIAKAAVARMGVALACEVGGDGIRVNVLAPGPIETPAIAGVYGFEGSELYDVNLSHNLIHRLGQADDVALAALYFASDESSFVTGAILPVDGGFSASGGQGTASKRAQQLVDEMLSQF